MAHLRLTIGHLYPTVVHIRVTIGYFKVAIGHYSITIGHNFFSISKHKANTTELHSKVRKTCIIFELVGIISETFLLDKIKLKVAQHNVYNANRRDENYLSKNERTTYVEMKLKAMLQNFIGVKVYRVAKAILPGAPMRHAMPRNLRDIKD